MAGARDGAGARTTKSIALTATPSSSEVTSLRVLPNAWWCTTATGTDAKLDTSTLRARAAFPLASARAGAEVFAGDLDAAVWFRYRVG